MAEVTQQDHGRADAFLREALGAAAPTRLQPVRVFDETPLPDVGPAALLSFTLTPPTAAGMPTGPQPHYVVVGPPGTTPSYFPAYGFDAEQAFSFHVGRRFMVEMSVALTVDADEPPQARQATRNLLENTNPGVPLERFELAAVFRCQQQVFAVYRVTLRGHDVYCLGADCPPGFYALTEHPPQVALALHLGQLIRAEARDEVLHEQIRLQRNAR